MIRIYNFPAPSRALRPIWLCEEMGVPYEVEFVTFPSGADYRARHPLGSVPFLEDDGGTAMSESIAMLFYIAERHGPTPLLPGKDDPQYALLISLAVFSEATFSATLNPLLATKFFAPASEKKPTWLTEHIEARATNMLAYMETMLGDGPYFAGDRFTIADIAVNVSLGMWAGGLSKTLPQKLIDYQTRLAMRPALQRATARACGERRESA